MSDVIIMPALEAEKFQKIKIFIESILNAYKKGDANYILDNLDYREMYRNTLRNFGRFCQIDSDPPEDYEINFKNQMRELLTEKKEFIHEIKSIKSENRFYMAEIWIEGSNKNISILIISGDNNKLKMASFPHLDI